jgi:hypothetical protein
MTNALAGYLGAIYFRPRIVAITISFADTDPDTILDSGGGFILAGFQDGATITVTGSTSNNGTYLIDTVTAGVITLDGGETLSNEAAGDGVTILQAAPGRQLLGFTNWEADYNQEALESTAFDSPGNSKEYIPGLKGFNLSAESWFSKGSVVLTAATVAFVDSNPDTITDSGSGFVAAGFKPGKILISGAANAVNNGNFTIASVAAGTLTLVGGDALTAEGAAATVTIVQPLGLNPGQIYQIRLFTDFGNTKYIEGVNILTARSNNAPVAGLIGENLTLQGTGVLTENL